jgi:hypothetical protein
LDSGNTQPPENSLEFLVSTGLNLYIQNQSKKSTIGGREEEREGGRRHKENPKTFKKS